MVKFSWLRYTGQLEPVGRERMKGAIEGKLEELRREQKDKKDKNRKGIQEEAAIHSRVIYQEQNYMTRKETRGQDAEAMEDNCQGQIYDKEQKDMAGKPIRGCDHDKEQEDISRRKIREENAKQMEVDGGKRKVSKSS